MSAPTPEELAASVSAELFDNILPYWFRLTTDDSFLPALDNQNQPLPDIPLGLIMVARLLWTYSRAYNLYGKDEHRGLAAHAKNVLTRQFADPENGGFYWSLGETGQPLDTRKQCYGQAFCIYAFSEHYHATEDPDSLARARDTFRLLQEKAWEPDKGGYLETFQADWTPMEEMRLSDVDHDAPKTMNNHLHLIEAFANLQKVAPSPEVKAACIKTLRIIADRIILPDTPRFGLFYDRDWRLLDPVVSPGHDIEGSWLLYEAADIIGDPTLQAEMKTLSLRMAELVYQTGLDPKDYGVYDEFHLDLPRSDTKCWWPQAEGLVGFYNAYQLSGDTRYYQAATKLWNYIQYVFIDREHGEWIWGVHADGKRINKEKAGPWKSAYHNGRACFEILSRLQQTNP